MRFNALLKRVTPQNVKSIFRYNISSKQLIFSDIMGNYVPLQTWKKFFTSEVKGVT